MKSFSEFQIVQDKSECKIVSCLDENKIYRVFILWTFDKKDEFLLEHWYKFIDEMIEWFNCPSTEEITWDNSIEEPGTFFYSAFGEFNEENKEQRDSVEDAEGGGEV